MQTRVNSNSIIDFSIITLFVIFLASAASFLESDLFVIVAFVYVLLVFIFRENKIDNCLWGILGVWLVINCISYLVNKTDSFSWISFFGVTLRLIMPYFMVKSIGPSFFNKFFKYAYVLVLLSFPFYLCEWLFPSVVSSFAPYLNWMTQKEQLVNGGFYIFIYMHSGWFGYVGPFLRNCGFMWEPGGYACILVFLLAYYLNIKSYRFDHKVIVLIFALLSTFSTSGFIALFMIGILSVLHNKTLISKASLLFPLLIISVIVFGIQFYRTNDFMKGKIDVYIENGVNSHEWSFEDNKVLRVSRLGIAIVSVDNAVHRPWGEGILKSDFILQKYGDVQGPSALAEVLRQWGWIGLFTFFYILYNFTAYNTKLGLLMLVPLSIMLFSNPFHFKYLMYAMMYFQFIYHNCRSQRCRF